MTHNIHEQHGTWQTKDVSWERDGMYDPLESARRYLMNQPSEKRPGVSIRVVDAVPPKEGLSGKRRSESDKQFVIRIGMYVMRQFEGAQLTSATDDAMKAEFLFHFRNEMEKLYSKTPGFSIFVHQVNKLAINMRKSFMNFEQTVLAAADQIQRLSPNLNMMDSSYGWMEAEYESVEPTPTIIGVADTTSYHVVYVEGELDSDDDGAAMIALNVHKVEAVDPDSRQLVLQEDAWNAVDYLIGEGHTPVTIIKGDEIIAFRWLKYDQLVDDEWRSGNPDKYDIPEDYQL